MSKGFEQRIWFIRFFYCFFRIFKIVSCYKYKNFLTLYTAILILLLWYVIEGYVMTFCHNMVGVIIIVFIMFSLYEDPYNSIRHII